MHGSSLRECWRCRGYIGGEAGLEPRRPDLDTMSLDMTQKHRLNEYEATGRE